MEYNLEKTIAAISTAPFEGGIGIIRMSGDKSLDILKKIFKGKVTRPNEFTYGHIYDGDNLVDEVMVSYMKAPKSYTREDVVEIQCHGGIISVRKILELVIKEGATLAERGEFTKRAFLNGRLDLTQAEAVIDLIKAKSEKEMKVSLSQLNGNFSQKIKDIRGILLDTLVNLTVNIDYPDEDIEELTYANLKKSLSLAYEKIDNILVTFDTGKILKDGLKVSIIGKPNVGKSSLMNALLKESRAIVTDIPGTTRDTIEEGLVIKDIPINLIDTAGIRDTEDTIERIGIEKSKEAFNSSDLILFLVDSSREISEEDIEISKSIGDKKAIVILSKSDLERKANLKDLDIQNRKVIEISTLKETGMEELQKEVEDMVYGGRVKKEDDTLLTNVRHKELLLSAKDSLGSAISIVDIKEPLEIIEIDVNKAYEDLGEIIGETFNDNVLDEVFKRFCLGK